MHTSLRRVLGGLLAIVGFCALAAYITFRLTLLPTTPPPSAPFAATERFAGMVNGTQIIFEDADYTRYRMAVNNIVTEGELNTERGYGTDTDATVYVLDWKMSAPTQRYFVRFTKDPSHLQILDGNRGIVPGALLQAE